MKRRMGVWLLLVVGLLIVGLSQAAPSVSAADTSQTTAIKRAVVKKGKLRYLRARFPALYQREWEIEQNDDGDYEVTGFFKLRGHLRHFEAVVEEDEGEYRCTDFQRGY
ncbi:hypothetical protein [Limosilactobacillus ingluviei]|uniref:hypothetical protein n=1 Tax=Limosilactobacillus ingluviei TaxID=148604 RepID=UPI001E1090A9|nr:hypothetical protein [Limosilactobacillus ingluviei]HJG50302.1 hypothetical protein [Limosilactobacillus ingluviei]